MARKKASNEVPAGSVVLDGGEDPLGANPLDDLEEAPAGRPKAVVLEESFLDGQADLDRATARAKHVDDGLKDVAEMVDRMKSGLRYARQVHDLQVKLAVLSEIADTAAAVTDDARRAVRSAQAERRNLQS